MSKIIERSRANAMLRYIKRERERERTRETSPVAVCASVCVLCNVGYMHCAVGVTVTYCVPYSALTHVLFFLRRRYLHAAHHLVYYEMLGLKFYDYLCFKSLLHVKYVLREGGEGGEGGKGGGWY